MILTACVDYDDPLVAELIRSSLERLIPDVEYVSASTAALQWSAYEEIAFETILKNPQSLCNSYIFRKALIRKHFLATTIQQWLVKHPESSLQNASPPTHLLECDYAEYLDEALNEAYELERDLDKGKWFILKPSMSDRGQGIRLFSTREELESVFEEFEEDEAMAQLRHFVVQEYIHPPLLINERKFHIRTYVVAFGAIKVWVWKEMLALFAGEKYTKPGVNADRQTHFTNTCLQDNKECVMRFWDLPISTEDIFKRICEITGEVFKAAASGQQMHFQTIPNAFEIFGVDFMLDENNDVYLLEINSYPDFKQTGEELTNRVVGALFDAVTKTVICPFFNIPGEGQGLINVLDIELRGW